MNKTNRKKLFAQIKAALEAKANQPQSIVTANNNVFIVYGFGKFVRAEAEKGGFTLSDDSKDLTALCQDAFGVWLRLMRRRVS